MPIRKFADNSRFVRLELFPSGVIREHAEVLLDTASLHWILVLWVCSSCLRLISPGPNGIDADYLVAQLDAAGINRAVVLSVAYSFSNPNKPPVPNEYAHVMAENNWTSAQVAKYPHRLLGFCSVNPLRPHALEEVARCAKDPNLRTGLKLHFGNSDVNLDNPGHLARVRRVFRAANENHMAIVVHMHANIDHHRPYGAKEARIFLEQLLPEAPDVVVQIAHLAGGGGYDDRPLQVLSPTKSGYKPALCRVLRWMFAPGDGGRLVSAATPI